MFSHCLATSTANNTEIARWFTDSTITLPWKNMWTTNPYYIQKNGKYVVADMRQKPVFDSNLSTIFPRMYSREDAHIDGL